MNRNILQAIATINRPFKVWLALLLSIMCSACVAPATRIEAEAASYGFESQTVLGTRFFHRIYHNNKNTNPSYLHVYIEGDGLPWISPFRISPDPTPRTPLMLKLMAQDPSSAIYLGRPCYFGLAQVQPCNEWWWTDGRFAAEVVDSMTVALKRVLPKYKDASLVFIGHSGGGALAMLLAAKSTKVNAVVTLAGNLDIEAWTQYHHFSELSGSANPAMMAALGKGIRQLHLQGCRDENIPPRLAARFAEHQPNAHFKIYPEFDHRCCWQEKWPDILQMLAKPV